MITSLFYAFTFVCLGPVKLFERFRGIFFLYVKVILTFIETIKVKTVIKESSLVVISCYVGHFARLSKNFAWQKMSQPKSDHWL